MLSGRNSTVYSMTKGGYRFIYQIITFLDSKKGVRVNAIVPGRINRPMLRDNINQLIK